MSILDQVFLHSGSSICRLWVFNMVWRTQLKQKDCQCDSVWMLLSIKWRLFSSCHVLSTSTSSSPSTSMLAQAQLQLYLLTFVKCSVHVSDCVTINVRTDVCIGVSTHSKLVDAGTCEKTAYGQMPILTHLSCKKTVLQQLSLVVRQSYYRDMFHF